MNAVTDLFSYIGFLVVVIGLHEAGHFFAAKRFGLVADVFSLGFGKVLFSRRDKAGTSWQIRALPLGGFIKLNAGHLAALPPLQRIAIYAAGPAVNMVLGLVLVAVVGIELRHAGAEIVARFPSNTYRRSSSPWSAAVTHVFSRRPVECRRPGRLRRRFGRCRPAARRRDVRGPVLVVRRRAEPSSGALAGWRADRHGRF